MIRSGLASVRDRLFLKYRPRNICLLAFLLGAFIGWRLLGKDLPQPMAVYPSLIGGLVLAVGYAAVRPSEYQLRHRLADDLMIVPLHSSVLPWKDGGVGLFADEPDSYGSPAGSPRAVELEKDRSVLVLGETGSGKSKAIEVLAAQMQAADDEPLITFDYKQDWQEFFADADNDLIRLSSVDSDRIWNVFGEIREDNECDEIAAAVFATAGDTYFVDSAMQVFADLLRMLRKWGEEDDYEPSNRSLVRYMDDATVDSLREDFEAEGLSSAKHLSEDAEASENIMSNLELQISKVFIGDFGKKGEFSIREYMEQPEGKTLVFDLPIDRASSVAPIYRLWLDWSIRFGMLDDRAAYYVLDEFASLPPLHMLERLANAGRAYNCYAVLGVQSVEQLTATYGQAESKSLLSGLAQEIHLRVGEESVGYWRRRLGQRSEDEGDETDEYPISKARIQNLEPGRGVVHTTSGWQMGRLYMLEEVEDRLLPRERSRRQQAIETVRRLRPGGDLLSLPPSEENDDVVTDGGETDTMQHETEATTADESTDDNTTSQEENNE